VVRASGTVITGITGLQTIAGRPQQEKSGKFDEDMKRAMEIVKREGTSEYEKYLDRQGYSHVEGSLNTADNSEAVGLNSDDWSSYVDSSSSATPLEKQPGYCVDPVKCDGNIDVEFYLVYDGDEELFYHTYFLKYEYGWAPFIPNTDYPADPKNYPRLWGSAVRDEYIGPRWPKSILAISWSDEDELIPASKSGCNAQKNFACAVNEDEYAKITTGSYTGEGLGLAVDGYTAVWDNGPSGPADTATTDTIGIGIKFKKGPEFKEYTRLRGKLVYPWKGSEAEVTVGYPASISYKNDSFKKKVEFQHTKGDSREERESFDIRVSEVM